MHVGDSVSLPVRTSQVRRLPTICDMARLKPNEVANRFALFVLPVVIAPCLFVQIAK